MIKYLFLKSLLPFFLIFVVPLRAKSQNTTVTIGTGIASSSSASGPINTGSNGTWKYSRQNAIYLASELTSQGILSGSLSSISWYKDNTQSYPYTDATFKIYVKHTTQASYATSSIDWATEVTGATLVYSSTTQSIGAGTGWQNFVFNTPFNWNGNDNLEIFVDWYRPNAPTGAITWRWTGTPNTNAINGDSGPFTTVYRNVYRPNVQLTFRPILTNDAGIAAIVSPVSTVLPGAAQPVQATIRNFGGNPLTSAIINWSVDGVLKTPFSWTGNVAPAQTSGPITIGSFSFPAGSHALCAWTQNPNNSPDANSANDSSCVTLSSCFPLAGNYSINAALPASASNFTTFSAAASQLTNCGVTGPVTFTVAPGSGPYNELVELKNISGASTTNTVTFLGGGVAITGQPTATKPAIITLNGATYVTLDNLNLPVTGTVGGGILLKNQADNNTVSNCNINMPVTGAYDWIGILAGTTGNTPGTYASNCHFINNTITGGLKGIVINGTTSHNNQIKGNRIRDFYNRGISLENSDATLVQANDISRPARSGSLFTGIWLGTGNRNNLLSGNSIHNYATVANDDATGIDFTGCDAPAGQENVVYNNLIYGFNNTQNKYAFSNTSSDGVYYYHNTVYLKNAAASTGSSAGFYQTQTVTNVKFNNNIIYMSLAGTHKNHALYIENNSQVQSNNNVIYLDPATATNSYTGFDNNTDYATLANWQTARSGAFDQNSLALDPLFANAAQGNFVPVNTLLQHAGMPISAVTTDFWSNPRSATGPTPGAFEFGSVNGLRNASEISMPVTVWPNPFSTNINLQVSTEKAEYLMLTLVDALGRTVYQSSKKLNPGSQTLELPLSNLPKGFYILKLEQNGRTSQKKLIKL